jgi:hypothetical protein
MPAYPRLCSEQQVRLKLWSAFGNPRKWLWLTCHDGITVQTSNRNQLQDEADEEITT